MAISHSNGACSQHANLALSVNLKFRILDIRPTSCVVLLSLSNVAFIGDLSLENILEGCGSSSFRRYQQFLQLICFCGCRQEPPLQVCLRVILTFVMLKEI